MSKEPSAQNEQSIEYSPPSIDKDHLLEGLLKDRLHYDDNVEFFRQISEFRDLPGVGLYESYKASLARAFEKADSRVEDAVKTIHSFADYVIHNKEAMDKHDIRQAEVFTAEMINDYAEACMSVVKMMTLTALEQRINPENTELVLEFTLKHHGIQPMQTLLTFTDAHLPNCSPVVHDRLSDFTLALEAIRPTGIRNPKLSQAQVEGSPIQPATYYHPGEPIYILNSPASDPSGEKPPMLGEVVKSLNSNNSLKVRYFNPDEGLKVTTVISTQIRPIQQIDDRETWARYREHVNDKCDHKRIKKIDPKKSIRHLNTKDALGQP